MSNPLTAAIVTRRTLRDQLLTEYPSLAEEEETRTLNDTLAGIDDFEEQVVAIAREVIEREAHAETLGKMIKTMTQRKQRLENGATTLRLAVTQALQEAGVKRIKAPDLSLSVGVGRRKVIITDASLISDALCKLERTPSKTMIAEALAEGDVPGATFGNAEAFLSIRQD